MREFELIEDILRTLGDCTTAAEVVLGPGDDAAILAPPADIELVASIDTLVEGVHFPLAAVPQLVGYRALMVSVSDLAAMGAAPGYGLVALSFSEARVDWVRGLAEGLRLAAQDCGLPIVGGNLTAGPTSISVSVHGWVAPGTALTRSGARPGDGIYVTGELGGAAAAVSRGGLEDCRDDALDPLAYRYFKPQPRLIAGQCLRGVASGAIDVSDGLLQDLDHICSASSVGAELVSEAIPIAAGASIEQALTGGDDYELCFTSPIAPPELACGTSRIGTVVESEGIFLDGIATEPVGYEHFAS